MLLALGLHFFKFGYPDMCQMRWKAMLKDLISHASSEKHTGLKT